MSVRLHRGLGTLLALLAIGFLAKPLGLRGLHTPIFAQHIE